jgi:chemotaxis protein MotB
MATRSRQSGPDIWPGFVDALSALFIIVLFVSMVFMGAQFFLSDALIGRDRTITRLQVRINELSRLLGLEQTKAAGQQKTIAQITADLQASLKARQASDAALAKARDALGQERAARSALEKERVAIVGDLESARTALASAQKDKSAADKKLQQAEKALSAGRKDIQKAQATQKKLAADRARVIGELEDIRKAAALLRKKRAEINAALKKSKAARKKLEEEKVIIVGQLKSVSLKRDTLQKQNEEVEKQRSIVIIKLKKAEEALLKQSGLKDKTLAEIVILNRQIAALRRQLAAIQAILKATEDKIKDKDVAIKDLSTRLNKALASRVQELERYRSEFFGLLRKVLGKRKDIKIVGDRFVFQSEVLFGSGSANLSGQGEDRLEELAKTLKTIMAKIPSRVSWVLRVDGHTDKRPIAGRYKSNWELSAARAISVVKFLIEEGIPARRLVAAGFGEQHPIAKGNTAQAYARNRRIEFKITQR